MRGYEEKVLCHLYRLREIRAARQPEKRACKAQGWKRGTQKPFSACRERNELVEKMQVGLSVRALQLLAFFKRQKAARQQIVIENIIVWS